MFLLLLKLVEFRYCTALTIWSWKSMPTTKFTEEVESRPAGRAANCWYVWLAFYSILGYDLR